MKTMLMAGLAGGLILFIWGALAWTVLPLHDRSMRNIENEDPVIDLLKTSITQKGVYLFPGMPKDAGSKDHDANMELWAQKYQAGPIGMIIYDPVGTSPMMPGQMVLGLLISIATAMIAGWFLSRSTASLGTYLSRVVYCGMLGVFITFFTHLTNLNWMGYPLDYTTAMIADTLIGWLLAGLGIAAVVKPPKEVTA